MKTTSASQKLSRPSEAQTTHVTAKPSKTSEPQDVASKPQSPDSFTRLDSRASATRRLLDLNQPSRPGKSNLPTDPTQHSARLGLSANGLLRLGAKRSVIPAPAREHRGTRRVDGQIGFHTPAERTPSNDVGRRGATLDPMSLMRPTATSARQPNLPKMDAGDRAVMHVNTAVSLSGAAGVSSTGAGLVLASAGVGLAIGTAIDKDFTLLAGKTIGEAVYDAFHDDDTRVAPGAQRESSAPLSDPLDVASVAATVVGGMSGAVGVIGTTVGIVLAQVTEGKAAEEAATTRAAQPEASEPATTEEPATDGESTSEPGEEMEAEAPTQAKGEGASCGPDYTLPGQLQGLMKGTGFEREPDLTYGAQRPRTSNVAPDAESQEGEIAPKTPGVIDPMIAGKTDVRAEAYARVQSRDSLFSDPNPNEARSGRSSAARGSVSDRPGRGFLPPSFPIPVRG